MLRDKRTETFFGPFVVATALTRCYYNNEGIDDMDIPLRRSRLSDEMEISCPFFKEKPRKYGAER